MWPIFLALLVTIIVSVACHWQIGRRVLPSIFLGVAAGLVVLSILQGGSSAAYPTSDVVMTRAVLYLAVAAELALGVYLAIMYPTERQVTVEKWD